jgi:uncharacterized membrane protein YhdT
MIDEEKRQEKKEEIKKEESKPDEKPKEKDPADEAKKLEQKKKMQATDGFLTGWIFCSFETGVHGGKTGFFLIGGVACLIPVLLRILICIFPFSFSSSLCAFLFLLVLVLPCCLDLMCLSQKSNLLENHPSIIKNPHLLMIS